MMPILSTLIATATAVATPTKTVELSDPRLLVVGSPITSVTTDGDTAYVCGGNTVRKVVYGSQLRVVDSLPVRSGTPWYLTKYVNLADGLGILAIGGSSADTSFWLIDWRRTGTSIAPGTQSRWVGYKSLQELARAANGNFNFSPEGNLAGVRSSRFRATFAGDKGVFQISVAGRNPNGNPGDLMVASTLSDSGRFLWSNVSLDTSDFVGSSFSSRQVKLFHTFYPSEDLKFLRVVDSSWSRSSYNSTDGWGSGNNLSSGSGKCWIFAANNGRAALQHCLVNGQLLHDTISLPSLATAQNNNYRGIFTASSRTGLRLLAGDSAMAFLDWNGALLPNLVGSLTLGAVTSGADFGDTTFWHASGNQLRGFQLRRVISPARAATLPGELLDNSRMLASWKTLPNANGYILQISGPGGNVVVNTTDTAVNLDIKALFPNAPGYCCNDLADLFKWRVSPAQGITAQSPQGVLNALPYSSWTGLDPRVTTAIGHRATSNWRVSTHGSEIRLSSPAGTQGAMVVVDGSGRWLGSRRIEADGTSKLSLSQRGLVLVRVNEQVQALILSK